jgi:hypothetical protein
MGGKKQTIYMIGRKHGIIPFRARPWKLEYQRRGELAGFRAQKVLKRVYSAAKRICRAFCVGDTLVNMYCIASSKKICHTTDMGLDDFDRFVQLNREYTPGCLQQQGAVIKAFESIGTGIGAIDFVMTEDGRPVFLEINPMWGGEHLFGNKDFHQRLLDKRGRFEPVILYICDNKCSSFLPEPVYFSR